MFLSLCLPSCSRKLLKLKVDKQFWDVTFVQVRAMLFVDLVLSGDICMVKMWCLSEVGNFNSKCSHYQWRKKNMKFLCIHPFKNHITACCEMGHAYSYLKLDRVEVSLGFASFQTFSKFEELFWKPVYSFLCSGLTELIRKCIYLT